MKNIKLKVALLVVVQLSILSCNDEDITRDDKMTESIYAGPPTELFTKQVFSSALSSVTMRSDCEDFNREDFKVFGDFSKLGTGAHLMWPGNLIQGNTIKTGELASIPVGDNGRNTIEVKVDAFSSSSSTPSSKTVEAPSAGKVQTALETIIEGFYNSGTKFPANYSIDIRRAFDSKQLQLALNVGYTGGTGIGLSGSFGLNFSQNKTYYAVTLKQKFFNVSVSAKSGLKGTLGWIKEDYPQNEINNYVSENNPAVYISTVTYGRLYALVYESDENSLEVEQALKFAYTNPTASITADQKLKYSTILQNSRVYVKQLGGNATSGLESSLGAFAGNFESVRNFIVKGAEVSKDNPGYPIEYTAVNVNSNLPVTIEVKASVKYNECKQSQNIANNYEDARKEVNKLKDEYGTGNTAKILIYNNTNKDIILKNSTPWYGSSFYNSPPSSIPARKYGFVLAVHKPGEATGTFNQLSYQLDNTIMSFGTYVPWSQVKTNNILVDFNEITEQNLYNNSTRPSIEKNQGNIRIRGRIDAGDSPFVEFTINQ